MRFVKVPQVDEERLDDELILLHPKTLQVKFLNETATVLWDALGILPSDDELAALLVEARPEIGSDVARTVVGTFLDELLAAGLIERQ
ncbi:MAG: PqqD family protein [Vicinamibacterales bacterium]